VPDYEGVSLAHFAAAGVLAEPSCCLASPVTPQAKTCPRVKSVRDPDFTLFAVLCVEGEECQVWLLLVRNSFPSLHKA